MASKREVADKILDGGSLHLHLDPRVDGVDLPAPQRAHGPGLVLAVGYRGLRIPIPDLVVDDEGVRGTLSFSGEPYPCVIPWRAIYALTTPEGRGTVWGDDMPPDAPRAAKKQPHELGCSLCERSAKEVAYLVAADRVSACNLCVVRIYETRTFSERVRALFGPEKPTPPLPPRPFNPYRGSWSSACSFCGAEHARMTTGRDARICRPCVLLAHEVLVERGLVHRS